METATGSPGVTWPVIGIVAKRNLATNCSYHAGA
jgi:hypothetical protein